MDISSQQTELVILLLTVFPLMYWSGLVNGEALAALVTRQYSDFLLRHKRLNWIAIFMMYPSLFAADSWFIYLLSGNIEGSALLKTVFLVPLWGGVSAGFSANYLSLSRLRWITYIVPALGTIVVSSVLLPQVLNRELQRTAITSLNLNLLVTGSLATSGLAAANSMYLLRRLSLPDEKIVAEIPQTAETTVLRKLVERLQLDGVVVTESPTNNKSTLHSGYVADSKIDIMALSKTEGLYLRFTHGLNPGYELQQFPMVRHALWMKFDWNNVTDLEVEKLIGYKEVKVLLRHSGVTVAVSGTAKSLIKYMQKGTAAESDKVVNLEARA